MSHRARAIQAAVINMIEHTNNSVGRQALVSVVFKELMILTKRVINEKIKGSVCALGETSRELH